MSAVVTETAKPPSVGSVLAGRYSLDALIARGGMGSVYRATDTYLEQPVAVKILDLARWTDRLPEVRRALANLRSEAVASIKLSHPNIVRTLNYERDGAWEFLVMEFVDGDDMGRRRRLLPGRQLAADDVRRLGVTCAHALEHAHARGLVHLDIKPANILLTDDGEYKICDFGLSSLAAVSQNENTNPVFMGTPAYASPEVIKGRKVDHRSDLYSLAATLYDLVTGQPPFGRDLGPALAGHVTQEPPKADDVPAALLAVILKGLAKDPEKRFQTARAMRRALQKADVPEVTPLPPGDIPADSGATQRTPVYVPPPPVTEPPPAQAEVAAYTISRGDGDPLYASQVTKRQDADDAAPLPSPTPLVSESGMRVVTCSFDLITRAWSVPQLPDLDSRHTLVLGFGSAALLDDSAPWVELSRHFHNSEVVGCSTAGEIRGSEVSDDTLQVTVAQFQHTELATAAVAVRDPSQSLMAGQSLARQLNRAGLRAVLILSAGLKVDGSALARGLDTALGEDVTLVGGVAGDRNSFERTWAARGGRMDSELVVAVGFYGDHLSVGHGSRVGWDAFGPVRTVTKAAGNVLWEVDGQPALDVFADYIGDGSRELPASGFRFPLAVRSGTDSPVTSVRTLVAIDESTRTLELAGEVSAGSVVQMMKASFDRLITAASDAGEAAIQSLPGPSSGDMLAIAFSSAGRRLVLGDRAEDELEALDRVLPSGCRVSGFYGYGELSPIEDGTAALHGQSMTVTVLHESVTPVYAEIVPGPSEATIVSRVPMEERLAKLASGESIPVAPLADIVPLPGLGAIRLTMRRDHNPNAMLCQKLPIEMSARVLFAQRRNI